MIANFPKYPHPIFEIMEVSEFVFVLTGSRFFKHATPESDWDFFVRDSPTLRDFLQKQGFKTTDQDYDQDPFFTEVFRFDVYYNGITHIDIQVMSSEYYDMKVEAQNLIFSKFKTFPAPKEHAKAIWVLAMAKVQD